MACHASYPETGREAVSKWSDVIKSSAQITASKLTETYLLNTVRVNLSEDGLIRRWRFGRKDPETRNRTIILLGETGTGKSTLINMMLNYMLGVKWEDKVRFQIIRDEGERFKIESQTTAITAYEIYGLENLTVPFSLTVIDTPGFGDTNNPEKDKLTAQNLYMLFSSSSIFKQIDAVCLVMKASQNRLSSSQKYIPDTILSLFGKNMGKKIMILITFSDWTPPVALNVVYESGVPFSKDVNNEPVHFQFNNLPPHNFAWKYKEEYQTGWNKGTESFKNFFKTLDKMEPQSLERAVNLSGERLSPPAGELPGNSAMAQSHTRCSETDREAVSNWSDVIKSSVQIASKHRETYLLNTDKEDLSEDGLIRRFGRKDPKTRNRTIILLGETGTGKSTLINMMLNYMLGVKWEDKVRFEIARDEGERFKTESHTTATTAYEIYGLENLTVPFSLTVIDTPGLGGTGGPEKDKITVQNLYKLFSSSSIFKQINAVCLVMKASQNRLSSSQKYISDTILSPFGKNMEKNIMILITFSDWTPPAALNVVYESGVPFSKDVKNEPVHFQFNNLPPHNFAWKYKEEYQTGWNKGAKSFRKFFKTLDKMEPQSLQRAVNVSGERLSPPAGELPGNSAMAQSHTSCSETDREAVSKWSDVIKSIVQIKESEPIQTYLLNTDREDLSEDGLIRRWRCGRKDPETRNRTIILLGETGTGKSALINMMLNYMLGLKWEDKVRFEIIRDENERFKTESQTTAITAYEIYGLENLTVPFSLTVIDTPGFGDPEGPEKDNITVQNLYKLLKSCGFDQIDAVCLVVKAFEYRLSSSQKYIFDTILSLFGKNLEKNIMILITFSDWTPPAALNLITESGVPFSKNESDEPVYFLFNNFPLQNFCKQQEEVFRSSWDAGTESFSRFFQALKQMKPQSLIMTINVQQKRKSLDTDVQSLESQIKNVQRKRGELHCKQKTLEELKENMRKHKKIRDEDPYAGWKMIRTEKAAIFCNKCEVLCPCPSKWNIQRIYSDNCTFCPGKCSFKHHDFNKDVYIPWDKPNETDVDDEEEAEHKIITIVTEISKVEQELRSAEAEMTKLQDGCFECIQQLVEIALKFDSDSTRQSIGRLTGILQRYDDKQKMKELQLILQAIA